MKKTTITIQEKPFTYDDEQEDINYDNNFAITEQDAREILNLTKERFNEIGLSWHLAFGTLLGAVRDHGLIKGDEDVDIFVSDEQLLYNSLPLLHEKGLKVVRMEPGKEYSFRINERCYIDVYILKECTKFPWSTYCYSLCGYFTPKHFLQEYESISFLGIDCTCPAHPEALLEFWYGKTWRTPVRGHKFYYEVKSHWHWEHTLKPRFQTIIGWPYWRHLVLNRFKNQAESLDEWRKQAR